MKYKIMQLYQSEVDLIKKAQSKVQYRMVLVETHALAYKMH